MKKEAYAALLDARRREFIDWLFGFVEVEKRVAPSTLARSLKMDFRTISNLKKGAA